MRKRFTISIWRSFSIAAILLLVSIGEIYSQQPNQIKFWHLTPEDGLSQSTGKAIYQDYKGYMWIGTQDGLNKYDGYEITVYRNKENDSTSIGSNNISALFEDSNQQLWIGTQGGGLSRYNRWKDSFVTFNELPDHLHKTEGLSDNTVFSIAEDGEGNLWFGTNNGLNIKPARQDTFQFIFSDPENPETISDNYIESLFKDSRGTMWIGTDKGLNRYDPEKGIFERINKFAANDRIYHITEDREGHIWIGTDNNGLIKYDYSSDAFTQYLNKADDKGSIAVNSVFSIIEDSRGVLWIGTESNGLIVFDRENQRFYRYLNDYADPNSLSNDAVYSLYESQDQILWIGTYTGGINLMDRKVPEIQHFHHDPFDDNSLSSNYVQAFVEDQRGKLWVGTDGGGLNLFDRNSESFQRYTHQPGNSNSIPNNSILELELDEQGNIWLGTYNAGVSRFDVSQNNFVHYKHNPNTVGGLSQNHAYALMEDSKNRIWAGTNGTGIDTLSPGSNKFAAFGPDSVRVQGGTINISYVRSLFEDTRGIFWIGTYGSGIIKYNPSTENFKAYHTYNSNISNNVILDIYQDQDDRLWIGTKGGGLNLYVPSTDPFEVFNKIDGFPGNTIYGILEDTGGNLWVSTSEGISKFNPESGKIQSFGRDAGLQNSEFNPGAAYVDSEGYFYFGGNSGFNRFHPDSIKPDTTVYPLYLSDFEIFNRHVEPGEDKPIKKQISEAEVIRLNYNQTVLTFEYATLNYNEVKGNTYAYKMDGFDDDWNYVGDRRSATYTNLDPGDYTFRVKAANSDNYWSNEASIRVIIEPPFWQTFWFYLLAGGVVILIGFSWYRIRVRSIQEQNKRLEEEVRERTSELNQRNEELKQTLQDLESTREELLEQAHKAGMADIATGVLHNVGNILNSVNTSSTLIDETLQKSKIEGFEKANQMLRENLDQIEDFFSDDGKGRKLLDYYLKLEQPMKQEHQKITTLSKRLSQKITLINEVISAQQSYATISTNSGAYNLADVVDEALMLNAGSSERHDITIEKHYRTNTPVVCQRTKLIHVLVNIYKNAKEAMVAVFDEERKLVIDLWEEDGFVYLSLSDNGHGITKENLGKIFNQGFTTKAEGHGFGLHSSANYIKEMEGEISVKSEGEGKGAKFVLKFKRA